jgi:hypothetical protein
MPSELSYKAPPMALGPIPDVDPYGRNPDYWEARKDVEIPIKQYFEWLNVNIWTCDLTLSHVIPESNGDGTTATATISSLTKVFEVDYRRENNGPGYIFSGDILNPPLLNGQVYQTTDPSFPYVPQVEGNQPVDWWRKQRSNVLIGNNQYRSYFNDTVNWENYKNPVGDGYISFAEYGSLAFGLSINSGSDTYYDPETKMVWPNISFESVSYNGRHAYDVNWQGLTIGADPYSTVSLTVDGVTIPAEVYWPNYSNSSGLSIAIDWTPGSTRDL